MWMIFQYPIALAVHGDVTVFQTAQMVEMKKIVYVQKDSFNVVANVVETVIFVFNAFLRLKYATGYRTATVMQTKPLLNVLVSSVKLPGEYCLRICNAMESGIVLILAMNLIVQYLQSSCHFAVLAVKLEIFPAQILFHFIQKMVRIRKYNKTLVLLMN